MNDQPDSKMGPVKPAPITVVSGQSLPTDAAGTAADATVPPAKLTAEEQMAAFEKALKEEDWGHQPC